MTLQLKKTTEAPSKNLVAGYRSAKHYPTNLQHKQTKLAIVPTKISLKMCLFFGIVDPDLQSLPALPAITFLFDDSLSKQTRPERKCLRRRHFEEFRNHLATIICTTSEIPSISKVNDKGFFPSVETRDCLSRFCAP